MNNNYSYIFLFIFHKENSKILSISMTKMKELILKQTLFIEIQKVLDIYLLRQTYHKMKLLEEHITIWIDEIIL
jgi:hypothetical protein